MAKKPLNVAPPPPEEPLTDASAPAVAEDVHEQVDPIEALDADHGGGMAGHDDPPEQAASGETVKEIVDDLIGIGEQEALVIRGLVAADRFMAALRRYRELRPGASIEVATAVVERLGALGPPPPGFELPSLEGAPPTVEESVVHPLGSEAPAGELHQFPPPAPRPELVVMHGRKVLRKATEDRRFPLSPEVFHAKALALANNLQAIGVEEARQKQVKATLKAAMGKLEEEGAKLGAEIRDGCEVRQVTVSYEADYDEGIVREIDVATGEVLATKPIAGDNAQVPLFEGEAPPAGGDDEEEEGDDDSQDEGLESEDDGDDDSEEDDGQF